jgi:DNA-binding Lrp family transcriptional regulator
MLKPQDLYVVLKIVAVGMRRPPYAQLASELGMSSSEVHASVERAQNSRLLHGSTLQCQPNLSALKEFLTHGLQYVFPADRGGPTRGIPTSYAAEPLRRLIPAGNEPIPVWPWEGGKVRGVSLAPLHRSAPIAALRDPRFYEYLALVDALREGRSRERKIAAEELSRRFGEVSARFEP